MAQNGNPCPGDKEYQFNILGGKTKNPPMDNNDGHRIFVLLNGTSKIYMTGDTDPDTTGLQCGNKFDVLDANGTDNDGATLLVPCDPLDAENLDPDVCFDVYATPLGKPGGPGASVDVVCDFDDTCLTCDIDDPNGEGDTCAMGNIDFTLVRNSGKPVRQNITNVFRASGCIDLGGTAGVCDAGDIQFNNEWIFNIEQLLSYYWDYTNDGLRLAQIRFCNTEGVEGACSGGTIVQ
ncbi:MAG: hypothetical protein ACRD5I_04495 [Candidatus Acidiferrales bacterium]